MRPLLLLALPTLLLSACGDHPADAATDAATTAEPPLEAETAPAPRIDQAEQVTARFQCGELLVDVLFDNTVENATLSWPDNQLLLPQAVSASGARYADDAGNELWNKGDTATLTLAGEASRDCRPVAADTP